MSSSGLIYAVIVGAWAAYLVPMWLRRQDELNEARPTERFSTAIRLLSGRAAMERRYAKDLEERHSDDAGGSAAPAAPEPGADPDAPTGTVDVRDFALSAVLPVPGELRDPRSRTDAAAPRDDDPHADDPHADGQPQAAPAGRPAPAARRAPAKAAGASAAERARRSKVLARRRRTTMMLFLAFTLGSVVAAVGGLAFLWAPAVPALLLSTYIVHLRTQERRRFV
ncbi:divisome protein SepX/GlpR, partial [Streptomyces lycii]